MRVNENIICDFVEAMLPRFSNKELCLYMAFDYDYTETTKCGKRQNKRKHFSVLFQRPDNYTKVLVNFEDTNHLNRENIIKGKEIIWKLMSDHDSCWRSDGMRFFNQLFNGKPVDFEQISFSLSGSPKYIITSKMNVDRETKKSVVVISDIIDVRTVHKYMQKAIEAGW